MIVCHHLTHSICGQHSILKVCILNYNILIITVSIVKGVVKKRRLLYLVGQTRVHCDEVDGLGRFMELEVCLVSLT